MAPAQGVLHRATFTLGVISLILNFASAFIDVLCVFAVGIMSYSEEGWWWFVLCFFFTSVTSLFFAVSASLPPTTKG